MLGELIRTVTLFVEMLWDTWWTLVLGFTITGAVETFVSEEKMVEILGGDDWEEVAIGTVAGITSSSCSFAATSTAKTLFKKGASAEASIAGYQFAATDLVAELALVLWVLMGWQFVAGEVAGGVLCVVIIAYLWKEFVPQRWFDDARDHLLEREDVQCAACGMSADPDDPDTVSWTDPATGRTKYFCCGGCRNTYEHMDRNPDEELGWQERATSVDGWTDAARNTVKEWDMLWDDILLGFAIASVLAVWVPADWWVTLFNLEHGGFTGVVFAAVVGVVIGVVTFLCSVGNIPFALVLWTSGVPFGAIMSFIYADLLIPPLVNTYRRYYGTRMAAVIFVTFAAASVAAGVVVHYVFGGLGLIPPQGQVGGTAPSGYTALFNLLFTPVFLGQVYVAYGPERARSLLPTALTEPGTSAAATDGGRDGVPPLRDVVDEARDTVQRARDGWTTLRKAADDLGTAARAFWRGLTALYRGVDRLVELSERVREELDALYDAVTR